MRTAFITQLQEEARKNDKIFLLVGDLGYHVVEPFAEEFPDRFLNVGIAEQNMAGVAAGLAMTGYNVYIYSIGNFPTLRCLEQIRNDIAYHYANVKIVSVGAGFAYGSLGATHQATEDIGVMRVIPNMVVATPGDPSEARAITSISSHYHGPMYIRLGKAGEKVVHASQPNVKVGDILPIITNSENKVAVLCCGSILDAAKRQIVDESLPYNLFSVPFVKPINVDVLLSIIVQHPEGLYIVEEHQTSCGVGSAIVELVNDIYYCGEISSFPKIRRLAIRDLFAPVVGNQSFLRSYLSLNL